MTAIDILALINQASTTLTVLTPILHAMHTEGRTEATPEELAKVRALALASEDRLDAATR